MIRVQRCFDTGDVAVNVPASWLGAIVAPRSKDVASVSRWNVNVVPDVGANE